MSRTKSSIVGVLIVIIGSYLPAQRYASAPIEQVDGGNGDAAYRPSLVIQSKVGDGRWSKKRAVYPLKGEQVNLRIADRGYDTIRWYLIFPDLTRNYQNANTPWEERAYEWTGFEKIGYYRIRLAKFENRLEISPLDTPDLYGPARAWLRAEGRPVRRLDFYHDDVGTFFFQVEATKGNRKYRSPGIEDGDERGISKRVMRISQRDSEGYLGYVSSLYNVPGVFGSVLSQSVNHIGADCADVLMTARAEWKRVRLDKNYNVNMVVDKFEVLQEAEMTVGVPDVPVRWGETIRPGDFIAVRYQPGVKKYHHIGALFSDANGNGLLDGEDLVFHAGPDPLHLSTLDERAFDGHIALLRH